jgi:hypothetical protein
MVLLLNQMGKDTEGRRKRSGGAEQKGIGAGMVV